MRRSVLALFLVTSTGCGIAHERGEDDAGPVLFDDGSVPLPDTNPMLPDAFVVPRDAWSPPFTTAPHGPLPVIPIRAAHASGSRSSS